MENRFERFERNEMHKGVANAVELAFGVEVGDVKPQIFDKHEHTNHNHNHGSELIQIQKKQTFCLFVCPSFLRLPSTRAGKKSF